MGMKISPVVIRETKKIAAAVLIMTVLMIAVFLMIGQFDYTVLLGALLGSAAAIGYFFLMALSVQKTADDMPSLPPREEIENGEEAQDSDPPLSDEAKRAGNRMRLSYLLRMLLMGAIALAGVLLPVFNTYAVLIPLLFLRIAIYLIGFLERNQKEA